MFRPIPFSPIRTTLYSPPELMETFDPDDYQPFERTLGIIDDLPSEELPEPLHWRPTVNNIYYPVAIVLGLRFDASDLGQVARLRTADCRRLGPNHRTVFRPKNEGADLCLVGLLQLCALSQEPQILFGMGEDAESTVLEDHHVVSVSFIHRNICADTCNWSGFLEEEHGLRRAQRIVQFHFLRELPTPSRSEHVYDRLIRRNEGDLGVIVENQNPEVIAT